MMMMIRGKGVGACMYVYEFSQMRIIKEEKAKCFQLISHVFN